MYVPQKAFRHKDSHLQSTFPMVCAEHKEKKKRTGIKTLFSFINMEGEVKGEL